MRRRSLPSNAPWISFFLSSTDRVCLCMDILDHIGGRSDSGRSHEISAGTPSQESAPPARVGQKSPEDWSAFFVFE